MGIVSSCCRCFFVDFCGCPAGDATPEQIEELNRKLIAVSRQGDNWSIIGLIQKGASSHYRDERGWLPLHHAAAGGHYTVIKTLLADEPPVPVDAVIDEDGSTALHLAARGGHVNALKELLTAKADVTIRNKAGQTAADLATDQQALALLAPAAPRS